MGVVPFQGKAESWEGLLASQPTLLSLEDVSDLYVSRSMALGSGEHTRTNSHDDIPLHLCHHSGTPRIPVLPL